VSLRRRALAVRDRLRRGRSALDPRASSPADPPPLPRPADPLVQLRPAGPLASAGGLRTLSLAFGCGGLLGLASLLVPRAPSSRASVLLPLALVALALGLYLWLLARRPRPRWVTVAALVSGCALVAAAVANDSGASAYALFFVWLVIEAALLLPPAAAFAYFTLTAAVYALALALAPHTGSEAQRWLLTVGTSGVAGFVVGHLRERTLAATAHLSAAANTDALTGLLNRRGFDGVLERELERARRSGRPLSIALGDVDGLKAVNDGLGHQVGDRAIVAIAHLLVAATRTIDVSARFGGDEFALVLPEADAAGARALAERVRTEVAGSSLVPAGMTISFGVAEASAGRATAEALVSAADRALYDAKAAGGDRTVVAGASAGGPSARLVTK